MNVVVAPHAGSVDSHQREPKCRCRRRSPRGERGLKFCPDCHNLKHHSRSPRGERGLKSLARSRRNNGNSVAPHAGSVD